MEQVSPVARVEWKPLPLDVWTLRVAGGFIKGRITPSRQRPSKFIAMINGELVGGPDAVYDTALLASAAAYCYILEKLALAATAFNEINLKENV